MTKIYEPEDEHLARDVKCPCGWVGWTGQLIVKDKLRCPKCDGIVDNWPRALEPKP
jgi:hypothetical protein